MEDHTPSWLYGFVSRREPHGTRAKSFKTRKCSENADESPDTLTQFGAGSAEILEEPRVAAAGSSRHRKWM